MGVLTKNRPVKAAAFCGGLDLAEGANPIALGDAGLTLQLVDQGFEMLVDGFALHVTLLGGQGIQRDKFLVTHAQRQIRVGLGDVGGDGGKTEVAASAGFHDGDNVLGDGLALAEFFVGVRALHDGGIVQPFLNQAEDETTPCFHRTCHDIVPPFVAVWANP